MDKWKTLSSKKILISKLFEVVETESELPSGIKKTQQNVIRKPTVCVFPVENNFVYLVSEFRELWNERMLHSVAGFEDKEGENSLQTAQRELLEEAGMTASHWKELVKMRLAGSVVKGTVSLFLAKDLKQSSQSLEDDETIDVVKLRLEDAVDKVLSGEISDSATMVGILILENLKKQKKI